MKREHRPTVQTEVEQKGGYRRETSEKATAKNRLLNTVFWIANRYDIPPFVGKTYWEIEKAYCMARIATLGGELEVQIVDETARFELSTRGEYRRAKNLGGERAVIEALLTELSGTETVWDVGACVGTYTCFVASALTTGHVVGFEPDATNQARLRLNLENNAPTERWEVSPIALSEENGNCTLSSEFVEAGGGHHYLSTEEIGTQVETRRGDSLIDRNVFTSPDVIKIDVQGAELAVLSGLDGVLGDVRSIYLEIHSKKCGQYGTTAEEVEMFLRNADYSLTCLGKPTNRRSGVYFVHASR
jgi:FkbM family methyltransferase